MGLNESTVRYLCAAGKLQGAHRFGRDWVIPFPIRREIRPPGPVPRIGRKVTIRIYDQGGFTDTVAGA